MTRHHANRPSAQTFARNDDDDIPQTPEQWRAFRHELGQKVMRHASDAVEGWRQCKLPACRRARACGDPSFVCHENFPRIERTHEEMQEYLIEMRRGLAERMAQIDAERAARNDQKLAAPSPKRRSKE